MAECIRGLCHGIEIVAAGANEPHDFRFAQVHTIPRPLEDVRHIGGNAPRWLVNATQGVRWWGRVFARGPIIRARQPLAIGQIQHPLAQPRVQPALWVLGEARIEGEPLVQMFAGQRGFTAQILKVRPRCFRVHEVWRERRNATPIVNACGDDLGQHARAQVRRRLHTHAGTEQDAGDGDGPKQLVQVRLGRRAHLRARLGAEVLHDELLDVAVFLMDVADGEQRFDAFAARLADADEDAGGERHTGPARVAQRFQTHRRHLVWRAVVRHALLREALGGGFQHDAHGRRQGPQCLDLRRRHVAGVQVGQQAGLLKHCLRRLGEVVQGCLAALRRQGFPRRPIAQLGLLAQGEQRFLAAERRATLCHFKHRVQRHVGGFDLLRRLRERAVVADVAA